ncbi:MAG: DUF6318 family protein [Cellulomonas sp.]
MADRGGRPTRATNDDSRVRAPGVVCARRGSRAAGVALWLAVALTLGGCTETAAPAPSSPGTPGTVRPAAPTTTPSAGPAPVAPPERPAAMDSNDADGAIAAATYFISLYPYVYATGDLAEWKAMSDPACIFCASVSNHVDEMVAKGNRLTGGMVKLLAPATYTPHEHSLSEIHLVASQERSTEVSHAGAPVSTSPASEADVVVLLTFDGALWSIRGVDLNVRS